MVVVDEKATRKRRVYLATRIKEMQEELKTLKAEMDKISAKLSVEEKKKK